MFAQVTVYIYLGKDVRTRASFLYCTTRNRLISVRISLLLYLLSFIPSKVITGTTSSIIKITKETDAEFFIFYIFLGRIIWRAKNCVDTNFCRPDLPIDTTILAQILQWWSCLYRRLYILVNKSQICIRKRCKLLRHPFTKWLVSPLLCRMIDLAHHFCSNSLFGIHFIP
jgi:hypothetical protein